jgi:hypothetical protein
MVGPLPFPHPAGIIAVPHDRSRSLDVEYHVGPLIVRPGGQRFTEWVRSEPITMESTEKIDSWPILVEGEWPGRALEGTVDPLLTGLDRQSANVRKAAMWLHRLVCLVSVARGEPWQVRHAPTGMDRFPPAVPASWPSPPAFRGRWQHDDLDPVPCALPAWIGPAWDLLDRDPQLASPSRFGIQGMLLTSVTPSFAVVAFTGAIERMAVRDGHIAAGPGERFRLGVRKVSPRTLPTSCCENGSHTMRALAQLTEKPYMALSPSMDRYTCCHRPLGQTAKSGSGRMGKIRRKSSCGVCCPPCATSLAFFSVKPLDRKRMSAWCGVIGAQLNPGSRRR